MRHFKVKHILIAGIIVAISCMVLLCTLHYTIYSFDRCRKDLLVKLFSAQKEYMFQNGSVATIDTLIAKGYIDSEQVQAAGNVILGHTSGAHKNLEWWATAGPWHPLQGNCYYINSSGKKFYHYKPFHFEIDKLNGSVPSYVVRSW